MTTLTLKARLLALDGRLDRGDVSSLVQTAQGGGGIDAAEQRELQALLTDPALADKFTPEARSDLQRVLGQVPTSSAATASAMSEGGSSLLGFLRGRNSEVQPPTKPADLDQYAAELDRKLHGFLNVSCVDHATAAAEMGRLGMLDDRELERVADKLGAGKTQRLIDRLAPADRTRYQATVDKLEQTHFGAVLGAAARRGLAPRDSTSDFDRTMAQVQAGTHRMPADAKDYVYLSVPGLITEHYPRYMDENIQRLRDQGLTVERSRIDTDAGTEANAATLRQEIQTLAQRTGKQVVLLAHSKGGPDAARALQDPATQDKVHLFVAMQPAYGGTPVADTVSKSPLDGASRDLLTEVWAARDSEAIADLTFERQKQRFSYDRGNPPLAVTTLSLATTAGSVGASHTPLSGLDSFMSRLHYGDKAVSDGMVPLSSQQIPGLDAHVVRIDGMGHDETIGQGRRPRYSPGDLTEALISVGLERAARQR